MPRLISGNIGKIGNINAACMTIGEKLGGSCEISGLRQSSQFNSKRAG